MNENIELRFRGSDRKPPASGRRRTSSIVRIVLASIAVFGIGAAITTAVWTDDVFFSATGTVGSFDLQGAPLEPGNACADVTTWSDVGLPGDEAVIEISTVNFEVLTPGEPAVAEFCLHNPGTFGGNLTVGPVTFTGAFLAGGVAPLTTADAVVALDGASIVAGGGRMHGTLTVTPPDTWTEAAFGATGTILFTVTGESIAP